MRGGRGGALGCYPGDDGFFYTGDHHSIPETCQPPYNGLRVVWDHRAGQEELRAQQSLMGPQTGQAGIELLPNLAHPQHQPLHDAIRRPKSSPHLVKQLFAEVPSQQAVQWLLIPTKSDPAEMLLETKLCSLQAGLR